MSNKVYLLLGSNRGNRLLNISKALVEINKRIGHITERSSLYETEPWGFQDEIPFVNFMITANTELSPEELLKEVLTIETELGRERNKDKNESREIDIDIIFYNDDMVNNENLTIPHPRIAQRKFVLVPLHEISPDRMHPVYHKKVSQLLLECKDDKKVRRFNFINR